MKLETTVVKQRNQPQRRRISLPRLRIRTSERKIFLFLVDILIVNLSLAISWLLAAETKPEKLLSWYFFWTRTSRLARSRCVIWSDLEP